MNVLPGADSGALCGGDWTACRAELKARPEADPAAPLRASSGLRLARSAALSYMRATAMICE